MASPPAPPSVLARACGDCPVGPTPRVPEMGSVDVCVMIVPPMRSTTSAATSGQVRFMASSPCSPSGVVRVDVVAHLRADHVARVAQCLRVLHHDADLGLLSG